MKQAQNLGKQEDGDFKVDLEEVNKNTVENINLNLRMGDMMMVCGKIGVGKTTLLLSLMNETPQAAGEKRVCGRIAYVE